jgi:predicted ATPase
MSNPLVGLKIQNFRSLADISIEPKALNVLFGPNGAGKSTFLDTIWFIRDCAIRGVDQAASTRSHGIGVLWDGAEEDAAIDITIETAGARYNVSFGFSAGRIEPFVGEALYSKKKELLLIDRKIGSDKVRFYHTKMQQTMEAQLREPERLAFIRYLDLEEYTPSPAFDLDRLLRYVHFYPSREVNLYRIRKFGSESSYQTWLWERCENLWSVLRNLHDRRGIDERYDTIIDFMRRSFSAFDDLFLEQTGPNSVYGHFIEKNRRRRIQASGVSDGHLQMLIHLTALFSEGPDRDSIILFDEPEASLHPYALAIFADAVRLATERWNKQVFIATHSPVLLSQFEPENILAVEIGKQGETMMRWVNEIEGVQDLLEEYATGSLYMAEVLAPQRRWAAEELVA